MTYVTYTCIFWTFNTQIALTTIEKSSPTYHFVICGSFKLLFYCELAHPLDVGVKLPRFWRKMHTKKKMIEREGVKGIVDRSLRFLKMIEYPRQGWGMVSLPLKSYWATTSYFEACQTLSQCFGSGRTSSQPWGCVQPSQKPSRVGRTPSKVLKGLSTTSP